MGHRPNVVIIILDTVRADYIVTSGEHGSFTPVIDRISREGVVFENTFAPSSWTLPSHATLFTGLYPHRHGAVHENFNLDRSFTTMAEILRTRGYSTIGINCNPWLHKGSGIAQGFDVYEEIYRKIEEEDDKGAALATSAAMRWIGRLCGEDKPFFLFINYLDAHLPFAPPASVLNLMKSKGVEFLFDRFSVDEAESYIAGKTSLSYDSLRTIGLLYHSEIAYLDERIGSLISLLRECDCLDNTFLVVTSDHGEHLGEHGLMGHEFTLFDTVLRIPLIIRYPPVYKPGLVVRTPVSLVDILPTVLELTGDGAGLTGLKGKSLLHVKGSLGEGERAILAEYSRPVTLINQYWRNKHPDADMSHYDRSIRALRMGNLKYLVTDRGEEFLFDLELDPGEENNLADSLPEELGELRKVLEGEIGPINQAPPG